MAMSNPYAAYQQNSVTTASPGELTLMLYNSCLKFINLAKLAITDGNVQEKNTNLIKAQKIINELIVTLNQDLEVSENMIVMYEYITHRLIEANVKNDQAILDEVAEYVSDFRDTWKQVIQLSHKHQFGQGGQT
ncbi:flagellar export chaperone FliS [Metabacillus arenae]|uniref:Flagellar secretion chaperone FliS n=1 Tax=Metabacillus arenae TaxID=2771434 RepID=A0A926NI00_9BACI|nr:flagellar export chaperone FliS [Metabacillus arenae]MBD1381400.1 flagellar export chaperone FliS [Metabacillus arenae]